MTVKTVRLILLFSFLAVVGSPIFSNENGNQEYKPRYLLSLSEALGYNILQTGFNRFILDAPFSYISVDSVNDNLNAPWVWDSDSYIVNQIGHPYQGSIYFTAARSNHVGFWGASVNTFIGSITWEYFTENERQSINDLIVTTTGGIVLGEMLYRFSEALWYHQDSLANKFLATLVSPISSINRTLFEEDTRTVKRQRIDGSLKISSSLFVGYAEFDSEEIDPAEYIPGYSRLNSSIRFSGNFVYGDHESWVDSKPFDYFTVISSIGVINRDLRLELFSQGLLKGKRLYIGDEDKTSRVIGLFTGLDFLYAGETINLGANTVGVGYSQINYLSPEMTLKTDIHLNGVLLGGSDYAKLKYLDSLSSPDGERRNYSIGMGENIKFYTKLEKDKYGSISLNYMIYGLHILTDTVEDGASEGYDITGILFVNLDKNITEDWRIGTSLFSYHKNGIYYDSENILQVFTGLAVYFSLII